MSRTKGAKGKKFSNRFKSFEGAKPTDRHIRLTHNMLMSEKCLKLSAEAFKTYCYMKLVACGKQEFDFASSCVVGKDKMFGSFHTYKKYRDELIDKGFIDFTNYTSAHIKREISRFMFVDLWQNKD